MRADAPPLAAASPSSPPSATSLYVLGDHGKSSGGGSSSSSDEKDERRGEKFSARGIPDDGFDRVPKTAYAYCCQDNKTAYRAAFERERSLLESVVVDNDRPYPALEACFDLQLVLTCMKRPAVLQDVHQSGKIPVHSCKGFLNEVCTQA